jgi:hypothetical protein
MFRIFLLNTPRLALGGMADRILALFTQGSEVPFDA